MSKKTRNSHLIREEFRVVLRVEVRFGRFGRVELKTLADTLSEDVERRIGLHDLRHSLLNEGLHSWNPISVGRMQVVGEIETDEGTSRRRVDRHVVRRVIEELGTSVTFDIVRIKISPSKLNVDPVL